jgi:hypothetical protein
MNFAETLLAGTVVAIVSAFVTVKLSLRRFHHEKLWERKLDSYTVILEALATLNIQIDAEIRQHLQYGQVSGERVSELQLKAQSAQDELARAIARGTFVIAEEAHSAVSALLRELDGSEDADSRGDYLNQRAHAVSECTNKMRSLAKIDLA